MEVRIPGPVPTEAAVHEEHPRLESFEEDSNVEEETGRSYVDHYHDRPAIDFDQQGPSGTDDGEHWFNEQVVNIHQSTNDLRQTQRINLYLLKHAPVTLTPNSHRRHGHCKTILSAA